jgi:hypothetical protein
VYSILLVGRFDLPFLEVCPWGWLFRVETSPAFRVLHDE